MDPVAGPHHALGSRKGLQKQAFSESGRQDLNLRPPGPQPGALPDCATPRGRDQAGDGNRTRPRSLEGFCAATTLRPHALPRRIPRHQEPRRFSVGTVPLALDGRRAMGPPGRARPALVAVLLPAPGPVACHLLDGGARGAAVRRRRKAWCATARCAIIPPPPDRTACRTRSPSSAQCRRRSSARRLPSAMA